MTDEAQGWGYQLEQPWPPPETMGMVTRKGRNFHRDENCSGYQQGVRNSIKRHHKLSPRETVTAEEAKDRGKGCCSVCWMT